MEDAIRHPIVAGSIADGMKLRDFAQRLTAQRQKTKCGHRTAGSATMVTARAEGASVTVKPISMKRTTTLDFNPEVFLAKVGKGRTLASYAKNKKIFSQ